MRDEITVRIRNWLNGTVPGMGATSATQRYPGLVWKTHNRAKWVCDFTEFLRSPGSPRYPIRVFYSPFRLCRTCDDSGADDRRCRRLLDLIFLEAGDGGISGDDRIGLARASPPLRSPVITFREPSPVSATPVIWRSQRPVLSQPGAATSARGGDVSKGAVLVLCARQGTCRATVRRQRRGHAQRLSGRGMVRMALPFWRAVRSASRARLIRAQLRRAQDAGVIRDNMGTSDIAALMRVADNGAVTRRARRVSVLLQGLRSTGGWGGQPPPRRPRAGP